MTAALTTLEDHTPPATAPPYGDFIANELCIAQEALAGLDWLALHASPVYYGFGVPRGDGTPVVLVPGLLASNASMFELRSWLARVGYKPCLPDIARNAGCPEKTLSHVIDCVDAAYEETGRRVYVVGHSLGGVLARAAAMARPKTVARVVTLGSPVNGCRVHPMIALASMLTRGDCDGQCMGSFQDALPDDAIETSIYSKSDGVVDWRTCFRDDAESIEVHGTHCGLAFNAEVFRALGRLFAQRAIARSPSPRTRRLVAVEAASGADLLRRAA